MLEVTVYHTVKRPGVSHQFVKSVAQHVFRAQKKYGEVSVQIVGEQRMRALNRRHSGIDSPTDVLSFALQEGSFPVDHEDWGDIFICEPYVRLQAKKRDISYKEELIRVLIHGCLHVLGYDHQTPRDKKKMYDLQEQYLKKVL